MEYEWGTALAVLIGGTVIRGIVRRADRSDPFSRKFSGASALDDCERSVDAALDKFHSPLR
jgi:hypothetical protein